MGQIYPLQSHVPGCFGSIKLGSCLAEGAQDVQARKRSLGNIRFIGFLFVQKLLSEKIMHTCIQQLLQSVSPLPGPLPGLLDMLLARCPLGRML